MARKEITPELIETFLSGYDPQERIVQLEYEYQDDFMKVFYRNEKDQKCMSVQAFFPFVWAKLGACLRLFDGDRDRLKREMALNGIKVKSLDITQQDGTECKEMLDGYRYMFYATKPMSYSAFLDFFKKAGCPIFGKNKDKVSKKDDKLYLAVTPQEQFLISTGKRFFKGYEDYNELLRMIFDLETEGLDPKKDRIKLNGIRFNRPVIVNGTEYKSFDRIFEIKGTTKEEKDKSELKIIETMIRIIYTFRPDIITAHNGENFDWNFIIERCTVLGTTIEDLSKKYFNGKFIFKNKKESILKLGGEIETFKQTVVPGTIITDSLHAVRRAQALDSNMLEANLKYVTKYSELNKKNRVYIPGDMIDTILSDNEERYAFNDENGDWYIYDPTYVQVGNIGEKSENKKFVLVTKNTIEEGYTLVSGHYIAERYLLDDLWECDVVEHRYNTSNFLICKMLPVPFQKCCTMGTAGQWKALLLAWSYENNLAIPPFGESKSFTGGLSRLLSVGFVDNVAKFDYNSLYPSIILTWGIKDSKDLMGAMLAFLEHVLTQREKYKDLKKAASKKADAIKDRLKAHDYATKEEGKELNQEMLKWKSEEAFNDKKQLPLKILGNSFFGSYGAPNVFPFGSIPCAERTTCTGRQSLRLMIKRFTDLGYKPIVGDTDGFNFKLPDDGQFRYTKSNPYIGKGLNRNVKKDAEYVGFKADVAEFNDLYMRGKMGLGIDEIVDSTINFSRKNYADYFAAEPFPKDVKLVGNTIKSKKMPEYISKFLEVGIRLLLQKKGQEFLDAYYGYIEKIYNYQIPMKQIASKGKVKKSLADYIEDCKTVTKSGSKKSRQAWMELALKNNLKVDLGETLYYINTGKKKADADVKRITHYYVTEGLFGDEIDKAKEYKKEYTNSGEAKGLMSFSEYVAKYHPEAREEDEIILNCELLTRDVVESEFDVYCEEGREYNVAKYIEQFNKRITPLLVCFSKDIRDRILITNPSERPYFTAEESELCSGQPNKESDQDTYEQLMTMEDKEIKFWMAHPEWEIPFIEECGMNWEDIKNNYVTRLEREKELGIGFIREAFNDLLLNLTPDEFAMFEDGKLPGKIEKLVDIDPLTGNFVSKEYSDIVIGTIYDIFDAREQMYQQMVDDYSAIL